MKEITYEDWQKNPTQGQLVQESWEKDGVKKTRLVVQVDNIQLIGSKGTEQKEPTGEAENIPF